MTQDNKVSDAPLGTLAVVFGHSVVRYVEAGTFFWADRGTHFMSERADDATTVLDHGHVHEQRSILWTRESMA